jgi:hypothetical protein
VLSEPCARRERKAAMGQKLKRDVKVNMSELGKERIVRNNNRELNLNV